MKTNYNAILIVSFGGPEGMDDVMPFLDNVLRGKNVPEERKQDVAHHYQQFGGVSPINEQNRKLVKALQKDLGEHSVDLPIYWGNRNWNPLLVDSIKHMKTDGIKKALAFITSAYSSYSSCRQYRENIAEARGKIGEGAPIIDKIRGYYNHPDFILANCDRIREALEKIPPAHRGDTPILFTAHSLPQQMAEHCAYVQQLEETCQLVAHELQWEKWRLVYQSRSGSPSQPWLEPDVCDTIRTIKQQGTKSVVIAPIGFVSDHMEILFDLDTEARELCENLGMTMERAKTVGTHPLFISMIRELIQERFVGIGERRFLGTNGPLPDDCGKRCCLPE